MAREVASEGQAIVCGSLSPVLSYARGRDMAGARREFEAQLAPFIEHDVDFVLAEVSCRSFVRVVVSSCELPFSA